GRDRAGGPVLAARGHPRGHLRRGGPVGGDPGWLPARAPRQAGGGRRAGLRRALREHAVLRPVTTLDLTGVVCPLNWVRTRLALEQMAAGDELAVRLDPG